MKIWVGLGWEGLNFETSRNMRDCAEFKPRGLGDDRGYRGGRRFRVGGVESKPALEGAAPKFDGCC